MAQKETIKNYIQETHLFIGRMWVAIAVISMLLVVLIGRLFYLQIIQKDLYTTLSRQNQFNLIPIEPNRGLVYDRNGVVLAENIPVFNLEIIPERVQNLDQTIADLQKIVVISPQDIQEFQKALKQHRPFEPVPLKIKLSDEEVARISVDQYRFPGVAINARLMRFYPLGANLNSVVGYVGRINEEDLLNIDTANYNGSNYIGKMGIEKYYEQELHGTVGYQQVEINANGRVVRAMKHIPTIPGDNIYLTIDSNLQLAAQQALGTISGAVIIIQPKTGQVLAMVSNPGYDPNQFVNGINPTDFQKLQTDPEKPLFNRAIRATYATGSTIKPYMAIEGLDSGVITPTYSISDPGYFRLPGFEHVYHDWMPHGHGIVNVAKAITQSCDVFFWGLGVKMGIDRIDDILHKFGFGQKTGIESEEELAGAVPGPAWKMQARGQPWYLGDTVSAAIGQGYISFTPIQMVQAVATIANRGVRYKPTLLLKFQKPDGTWVMQTPTPEAPLILKNPAIWDLVINAMKGVVSEPGGTAYQDWLGIPYTAAGKTGTAQVYHSGIIGEVDLAAQEKIPYQLRNHSLFIAFAPVENPQIAIIVVAEHSLVPARIIARKIVDYYMLTEHHWIGPQEQSTNQQLPKPTDSKATLEVNNGSTTH